MKVNTLEIIKVRFILIRGCPHRLDFESIMMEVTILGKAVYSLNSLFSNFSLRVN
jgi:hypothetical protein